MGGRSAAGEFGLAGQYSRSRRSLLHSDLSSCRMRRRHGRSRSLLAAARVRRRRKHRRMPGLPEVETTRRGLALYVVGRSIARDRGARAAAALAGRERRSRRRSRASESKRSSGAASISCSARAPARCSCISACRAACATSASRAAHGVHDHVDVRFTGGGLLRFNDPRRFGSWLLTRDRPEASAAQGARPGAALRRFHGGLPVACEPRPTRRDQAAPHERPRSSSA